MTTATLSSHEEYADETFSDLVLPEQELDGIELYDCTFERCSFSGSVMKSCSFNDCVFRECDLSVVQFRDSRFSGTVFETSKMIGVNWTLAAWSTLLEKPVTFRNCVMNHSTFLGLHLKEMEVTDCIIHEVDFRETNLTEADFSGCDLAGSMFGGANLTDANFGTARNYEINPTETVVKGTKFSLPEALSLLYALNIELVDVD